MTHSARDLLERIQAELAPHDDDNRLVPLISAGKGADGLMVEVHPCPERALSDGPQSLDFTGFSHLMRSLAEPLRANGTGSAAAAD